MVSKRAVLKFIEHDLIDGLISDFIVPSTPYSPVDRWTEWSSWGDCSNTCGMGEQSRMRDCRLFIQGLVIPSSNCEGSPAETMACELRRCPGKVGINIVKP